MIKKLQVNLENSKIIDGDLFITSLLAQNLVKDQSRSCDHSKKINHPTMGQLIKYNGEYNRSNIRINPNTTN